MNKCKFCGKEYNIEETQEVFGDVPWTRACCSNQCYTQHQIKCLEEYTGFKCECGNTEFIAHQVCHINVVVNGNNDWQRNYPDDNSCCYESNTPFGPYICTQCGQEYPDLSKRRKNLMKVQKDIRDNF